MIEEKKFQEIVLDFIDTQSKINTKLYLELCNVANHDMNQNLKEEICLSLEKFSKEVKK